jgi:hypothetical protein
MDLSKTIEARSDQLNADDLIGGPRVLHITAVRLIDGDQPVAINYEGDDGRPYKPCKSMRRVMVSLWGPDGSKWPGNAIEVYRDPAVKFGGAAVGGIRISKATGITKPADVLLTVKRGKRAPYRIEPLTAQAPAAPAPQAAYPDDKFAAELDRMRAAISSGKSTVDQIVAHLSKTGAVTPDQLALLTATEPEPERDEF